jgi:predicted RNase H-like HicB family nuclease
VVIERDEDGFLVGEVPQLRACYAQGRTVDELMNNIREVIALCLEDQPDAQNLRDHPLTHECANIHKRIKPY